MGFDKIKISVDTFEVDTAIDKIKELSILLARVQEQIDKLHDSNIQNIQVKRVGEIEKVDVNFK